MPSKSSHTNDLHSFVSKTIGDEAIRAEEVFSDGYVRLRVSEAERRQAKHDIRHVEDALIELLRNSRDASATHIFVASTREADYRKLVVLDDGVGIPHEMRELVFEPRVTSKLDSMHMDRWGVHGRGMALFSVKENVEKSWIAASEKGGGCSLALLADTDTLDERRDQSSWPELVAGDTDAHQLLRGPHNIIRTVAEFALDSEDSLAVFLGSPAEIVATIRKYMKGAETPSIFAELAHAAGAQEIADAAAELGLEISDRTAHRIATAEVEAQKDVLTQLTQSSPTAKKNIDIFRDRRSLKIAQDDLQAFKVRLQKDFEVLAEAYYLELEDEPSVHVSRDSIQVKFHIHESD